MSRRQESGLRNVIEQISDLNEHHLAKKFEWSLLYQLFNTLVYFNPEYKKQAYLTRKMIEFAPDGVSIPKGPVYQTVKGINRMTNRNWHPFVKLVLHEISIHTNVTPDLARVHKDISEGKLLAPESQPWIRS